MLFKLNRVSELKTPKISKIALPESPVLKKAHAEPIPMKRHSTTSSRTPTPEILSPRETQYPSGKGYQSPTHQKHFSSPGGGTSLKYHTRVTLEPMKTYDGSKPPVPEKKEPSRRPLDAGAGFSASPKTFVSDKIPEKRLKGDGYSTDTGAISWSKSGSGLKGGRDDDLKAHLRSKGDLKGENGTAAWNVNVSVGAMPLAAPKPKRPDGYATDVEPHKRPPGTKGRHSLDGAASKPHRHHRSRQEAPPALHSQLLADSRGRPPLRFDMAFPPTPPYLKTWDPIPRVISDEELEEPATETNIASMAIQLKCDLLPAWDVVIRRKEGVRCIDVFEAIYHQFNVPLTDIEMSKIPRQEFADYAKQFKRRCKDAPALTAVVESQGFKRVDLLRGRTYFRGMTQPDPRSPWVVELQSLPRRHTT